MVDNPNHYDFSNWTAVVKICCGDAHFAALCSDGSVPVGDNRFQQCEVSEWKGIADLAAFQNMTFGVTTDGVVFVKGRKDPFYQEETADLLKSLTEPEEFHDTYTPLSRFIYSDSDHGMVIVKYFGSEKSIRIPERIHGSAVTEMRAEAFRGCSAESIEIPKSVETIGTACFLNCSHLTSICLPERLKKTERDLFSYCENLTAIKFPDGLEVVEDGAFAFCTSLKKAILPDSVTSACRHRCF